jgi:hypothetical protein
VPGGLQIELLEFGGAFLAGIIGVVEGLDGFIEFFCLVEIAVAWGDDAGDGFMDSFGGLGETIHIL